MWQMDVFQLEETFDCGEYISTLGVIVFAIGWLFLLVFSLCRIFWIFLRPYLFCYFEHVVRQRSKVEGS